MWKMIHTRPIIYNEETSSPNLQEKTATQNGDVVADSGYDGLSKVVVNVSSNPTFTWHLLHSQNEEVGGSQDYYLNDFVDNIPTEEGCIFKVTIVSILMDISSGSDNVIFQHSNCSDLGLDITTTEGATNIAYWTNIADNLYASDFGFGNMPSDYSWAFNLKVEVLYMNGSLFTGALYGNT